MQPHPHSKPKDDTQLPKIHSQKRIHTADNRRHTEQDKALANRPLSNNCRTRSLRTFTTKTVKYESAGNVYNKKVEDLERQTMLVEREIRSVEDEIGGLRQNIGQAKKESVHGMSRLNESSASYFSKITTRKIALTDHETLKSELKNLQSKILNHRNKIDTHLQKNKAIEQQIDAYRKEISTLKNINSQLEASFRETSVKYDAQMELSKSLDVEIAEKTELTHKRKVDNMHQKAQMIKQYDVILRTLDKQLNTEKPATTSIIDEEDKSNFYITDVINIQTEQSSPIKPLQSGRKVISATHKKPKINEIRQKLKNYQKQFQQLKIKVGSSNIEEITKKFTQEYQNNFHQYNFINEMYQEYEEANLEQFQLLQKKNGLLKELEAQRVSTKVREICEYRERLGKIAKRKEKVKRDMVLFGKVALELKVYLGQYLNSSPSNNSEVSNKPSFDDLTDRTIPAMLYEIYEKHSKQLTLLSSEKVGNKRFAKNTSALGSKDTVQDLIEEVKKESQNAKDNRLLTRQELQRNTLELKEKKMEGSVTNTAKFKNKRQGDKSRTDFAGGKKSTR